MERRDFIKSAALAAGGVVVGGLAAEGMDKISEKDKNTQNRNMKVLLINGSARRNGNTSLALQEVAKSLEKQGIETEIVHIGAKAVRGALPADSAVQRDSDTACSMMIFATLCWRKWLEPMPS